MLPYNDALNHQQSTQTECILCKSLVDHVIWHIIKLSGFNRDGDYIAIDSELLVPVCLDCQHSVYDIPSKPVTSSPWTPASDSQAASYLSHRDCERLDYPEERSL